MVIQNVPVKTSNTEQHSLLGEYFKAQHYFLPDPYLGSTRLPPHFCDPHPIHRDSPW